MTINPFPNLKGARFMNLTTYRKTGLEVRTPVWFAAVDSKLYVHTIASAGKAKRIKNNPKVIVAPCKVNGDLTGDAADGNAHLVTDADEDKVALAAMRKKYGIMFLMFQGATAIRGTKTTRIVIEP